MQQQPDLFLPPSILLKKTREKKNQKCIDSFIKKFNAKLRQGETSLNDGLDCFSLNDREFLEVFQIAKKCGWNLSRYSDNYQTTSYTLKPIKKS